MTEIIAFLRNYDYDLCLAKGTTWTLEEAVDYLATHRADSQIWCVRDDAYKGFVSIRDQLAAVVRHAIDEGRLVIHEQYKDGEAGSDNCEIDFRESFVIPVVFISWAIDANIEVPEQFAKYAVLNKHDKAAYYEGLGVKKSCVHHERSRAVAELLWSIDPEIPIAVMARRSEIIQFGCEGHKYDVRTVSRWLASLKSDRRPGRRRKWDP